MLDKKYFMFIIRKFNIVNMSVLSKFFYRFNAVSIKILRSYFVIIERLRIASTILRNKKLEDVTQF